MMDQCYLPSCYHVHYCFNYHHSDNGYPRLIESNFSLIHASRNQPQHAYHRFKGKSHPIICVQVHYTDGLDGQYMF